MSFTDAVRSVYRNYATFSGRAPRSEFWWFVAFFFLVYLGGAVLSVMVLPYRSLSLFGIAIVLFWLASLVPYLAVAVRRLHDTDHSGWWLLASFIPFGGLVLLVFFASGGNAFVNRYGPPTGAINYPGVPYGYGSGSPYQQGYPDNSGPMGGSPQDGSHPLSQNLPPDPPRP